MARRPGRELQGTARVGGGAGVQRPRLTVILRWKATRQHWSRWTGAAIFWVKFCMNCIAAFCGATSASLSSLSMLYLSKGRATVKGERRSGDGRGDREEGREQGRGGGGGGGERQEGRSCPDPNSGYSGARRGARAGVGGGALEDREGRQVGEQPRLEPLEPLLVREEGHQ